MSYFVKKGKTLRLTSKESLVLHEELPVGTYSVGFDPNAGEYFLGSIEAFEIKHKLYGTTTRDAERILGTFKNRPSSTGVLLTGLKGSGKTLLAKSISITAAEENIPTIVVNQPFCGDAFNSFMQSISQPTVVIFDEYEKVYSLPSNQDKLLTLLDGAYPSQKLFLLTCNNKWGVNEHMYNRPGRIFYMLDFSGLGPEFVQEYCEDNLKNTSLIPQGIAVAGVFSAFNFDLLKGIVEEMNRYDETPVQVLKFLNARPGFGNDVQRYTVKIQHPETGKVYSGTKNGISDWVGNPLKSELYIRFSQGKNSRRQQNQRFNATDLKEINNLTSSYLFVNAKGYKAVLTRRKTEFEVNLDSLPVIHSGDVENLTKEESDDCEEGTDTEEVMDDSDY